MSEEFTVIRVDRDPATPGRDPRDVQGNRLLPDKPRALSEREAAFVQLYTEGEHKGNATQAAIAAGYSNSFATSSASKLVKRPAILAAVNATVMSAHRPTDDAVLARQLTRLDRIAHFDIGTVFEMDERSPGGLRLKDLTAIDTSCLQSIKIRTGPSGTTLEVKPYSALDAMRLHMQARGVFNDPERGKGKNVAVHLYMGRAKPDEAKVINP